MQALMDEASVKTKLINAFQEATPADLSVSEAAKRAGISPNTASTYIKVLIAEGRLEKSRRIGNAKLFRVKARG